VTGAEVTPWIQAAVYALYLAILVALVVGLRPGGWAWRTLWAGLRRLLVDLARESGAAVGREIAAPLAAVAAEVTSARLAIERQQRQLVTVEAVIHGVRRGVDRLLTLHGEDPQSVRASRRSTLSSYPPVEDPAGMRDE
jgi:hypothetical protein